MAIGIVHGYRPPAVISSSFFTETKWAKPPYSNWKQLDLHTSLDKQGIISISRRGRHAPTRSTLHTQYSQLTAVCDCWLLFDDWLIVCCCCFYCILYCIICIFRRWWLFFVVVVVVVVVVVSNSSSVWRCKWKQVEFDLIKIMLSTILRRRGEGGHYFKQIYRK